MAKIKEWWEYVQPGHTLKCIDVKLPEGVKEPVLGAGYGGSGWSKAAIIKVRVINVHGDHAVFFYEGSICGVYSYACEPCYQVGDWVIDESAKAPAAYKIISVNGDILMASKNSCFYSNQHGLRYATKKEIDKAILLNNSLSVNDLIIGNFYKITDANGTFLIIKFLYKPDDPNRIAGTYISNMNSIWEFKTSSHVWHHERRLEVATEEETIWLEACIKEDKFIKKEDIKKDTLPEKWCVKVSDIPRDLMEKWRKAALGISTYVDDNEYLEHTSFRIDPYRYPDRIILPFEQVKDYIYSKIGMTEIPELRPTTEEGCTECDGTGYVMTAKLYPSGHTEVSEICEVCGGEGVLEKEETMNDLEKVNSMLNMESNLRRTHSGDDVQLPKFVLTKEYVNYFEKIEDE